MNRKAPNEAETAFLKPERLKDIGICLVAFLLLAGAVRDSSLWIDEGQTWVVLSGSWSDLFRSLTKRGDAVSGMPLYFIVNYGFTRLTGLGEYAMRSLNLLFGALYLLLALRLLKKLSLPTVFLLIFAANPVFMYYMNEARPYVILLTLGMVLTLLLYTCDLEKPSVIAGIYAVLWAGTATHMMFVFSGLPYLLECFFEWRARRLKWKRHLFCGLCFIPLFLPLGVHYLWIMSVAPEVRAMEPGGWKSVLQIVYSFAGLTGLGLSRNDMRGMELARFDLRMAAETAAALLSGVAAAVIIAVRRLKPHRTDAAFRMFCGTALAAAAFTAANLVLGTRFWERHVIYLLPPVLTLFALCIRRLYAEKGILPKTVAVLCFAGQVVSGLNIQQLPYYRKDDYRAAVRTAVGLSGGGPIAFQGDRITFGYYGLRGVFYSHTFRPGGNANISNVGPGDLETLCASGRYTVILSEKKEFDRYGLCRTFRPGSGVAVNSFRILPPAALSPEKRSEASQ